MLMVFAAASLLGAALLFLVQPLFARLALPLLGGSPVVWNTALVFFQSVLLAGYAYAHATTTLLGVRRQALFHLGLLPLPLLVLPVALRGDWVPPAGPLSVPWLLGLMLVTVGPPTFAVAAGGPLLQRWLGATKHLRAADPYWLFATGNVGSMAGLLAYPFVVEPHLSLASQASLWTVGYVFLIGLMAACVLQLWQRPPRRVAGDGHLDRPSLGASVDPSLRPSIIRRARWLLLAAVPASLVPSVTSHISSDIAAVPLLWVVPLGTYLSTYVLAFGIASPGRWIRRLTTTAMPLAVLVLVATLAARISEPVLAVIPLHLLGLFVVGLACHRVLADDRPQVRHLTEYHLWLATGGACGGAFSVLLAPLVFPSGLEYPLALALGSALALGLTRGGESPRRGHGRVAWRAGWRDRQRLLDVALPIALGILAAGLIARGTQGEAAVVGYRAAGALLLFGPPVLIGLTFVRRPVRFGLGVCAIVLGSAVFHGHETQTVLTERTYFGIHRVRQVTLPATAGTGSSEVERRYHVLTHGSTIHGVQQVHPVAVPPEPLAYYHRSSPIGQALAGSGGQGGEPA
jgi:hypothetical protein